ncbi:MAG TPA: hypothetical protein VNK96_10090 [Fimbriimonadales bacterium]|nr:hypothetical protein [Fimbriimonadales bacterium]
MRRTDLLDTSEWAHKEMLRRIRRMSPAERLRKAIELSEIGREIALRAKRRKLSKAK